MENKLFDHLTPLRLNLGAGSSGMEYKKRDFVTIDIKPLENIDLVWDISRGLPFPDDSVELIVAHDFLEHVDSIKFVLQEMYRVSQHDAIWEIRVPFWANTTAFNTLSHKNFFSENTFTYFSPNNRKDLGSGWHEYGWNIWLECLEQRFNYHSSAIEHFGPQGSEKLNFAKTYCVNIVDTILFILKVVKKFHD